MAIVAWPRRSETTFGCTPAPSGGYPYRGLMSPAPKKPKKPTKKAEPKRKHPPPSRISRVRSTGRGGRGC